MAGTETAVLGDEEAAVPVGELVAFGLAMEKAREALTVALRRADAAETELGELADRMGAVTAAAGAAERRRADAAEAKLELVRAHAESWTVDDGQGPPTKEMLTEADCGRAVLNLLSGGDGG